METKIRRITEVWSNAARDGATGSYGSGYMLGGGLILTARHVLMPEGSIAPTEIKARSLGIADAVAGLQPADLVWPDRKQLADKNSPDAALLRLNGFGEDSPVPQLGPPDSEEPGWRITVHATGFPFSAPAAQGGKRNTEQIVGRTLLGTAVVSGRYEIQDLTLGETKSDLEFDWRGMSGAAVLANNDRVIGVLIARKTGANRYDFSAERIEKMLSSPGFQDGILGHAVVAAGGSGAIRHKAAVTVTQFAGLVSALEGCEKLATEADRSDILNQIRPEIRRAVRRRSDMRSDLMNIVRTAADHAGGLEEFLQAVDFYENGATSWRRVVDYVASTLPGLRLDLRTGHE